MMVRSRQSSAHEELGGDGILLKDGCAVDQRKLVLSVNGRLARRSAAAAGNCNDVAGAESGGGACLW